MSDRFETLRRKNRRLKQLIKNIVNSDVNGQLLRASSDFIKVVTCENSTTDRDCREKVNCSMLEATGKTSAMLCKSIVSLINKLRAMSAVILTNEPVLDVNDQEGYSDCDKVQSLQAKMSKLHSRNKLLLVIGSDLKDLLKRLKVLILNSRRVIAEKLDVFAKRVEFLKSLSMFRFSHRSFFKLLKVLNNKKRYFNYSNKLIKNTKLEQKIERLLHIFERRVLPKFEILNKNSIPLEVIRTKLLFQDKGGNRISPSKELTHLINTNRFLTVLSRTTTTLYRYVMSIERLNQRQPTSEFDTWTSIRHQENRHKRQVAGIFQILP